MQIELDQFLIDICTGSVLNHEQAMQLWKIIGNKRKMWRAAEDAEKHGYETTFDFAVSGVYNNDSSDSIKSIIDHALFRNAPCAHCKNFYPKEQTHSLTQWCHAQEQFKDFSCFQHKG